MTIFASLGRAMAAVVATVAFVAMAYSPCAAQYAYGLFFPLNTLEKYFGPVFPKCGITNSFRSEVGAGIATAPLQEAKITGSSGTATFDLRRWADLDQDPQRLDVYADLRIWRFAFRPRYWNFDTRSKHRNLAKIDLTGLILGGDVDLVQHEWLSIGARTDFYLLNPRFQGALRNPFSKDTELTLNIKGDRPITVGPYLRYVPPEILGWPLHVEAYWNIPIKGTRLSSYGGALVFRPQIYRFDIAARLFFEDTWMKFTSGATDFVPAAAAASIFPQDWKLNAEWYLYGINFAVYF